MGTPSNAVSPAPEPRGFSPLAIIAVILGLLLAIAKGFVWSKGNWNAEVFGYVLAGALLPGAIAYAIAGRKKARNPNRFALWFFVLCLVSLLLEIRYH